MLSHHYEEAFLGFNSKAVMVSGMQQDGPEGILHCFVSGISCLTQKTQKNSSKFWVLSAAASVKKILPLSSRVQRFGHNVPCQMWWPQLQARFLAMLG